MFPFERLLAFSPCRQAFSGTFLFKSNIRSTNRAAFFTRVLDVGEDGDSPLPSSVKVHLEPAREHCQPQILPSSLPPSCFGGVPYPLSPSLLHPLSRPLLCPQASSLPPTPLRGTVCVIHSPSTLWPRLVLSWRPRSLE